MNVCVIDDIEIIANDIKNVIEKNITNISDIYIYVFYDMNSFYKWLDNKNTVDICFLDINLDGEENSDGIKIAKRLKEIDYHTLIIFLSSYNDYYDKMVQVEPFRFLPKPFSAKKLIDMFNLAYERYTLQNKETCMCKYKFKYNGITFKVDLNEVEYMYSIKRKIYIKTIDNHIFEFYEKLDNVEKEISILSNDFLRISKSYLINKQFVETFNKNYVQINNEQFSIGGKYKEVVIKTLIGNF